MGRNRKLRRILRRLLDAPAFAWSGQSAFADEGRSHLESAQSESCPSIAESVAVEDPATGVRVRVGGNAQRRADEVRCHSRPGATLSPEALVASRSAFFKTGSFSAARAVCKACHAFVSRDETCALVFGIPVNRRCGFAQYRYGSGRSYGQGKRIFWRDSLRRKTYPFSTHFQAIRGYQSRTTEQCRHRHDARGKLPQIPTYRCTFCLIALGARRILSWMDLVFLF